MITWPMVSIAYLVVWAALFVWATVRKLDTERAKNASEHQILEVKDHISRLLISAKTAETKMQGLEAFGEAISHLSREQNELKNRMSKIEVPRAFTAGAR